jgi:hypothetical protein
MHAKTEISQANKINAAFEALTSRLKLLYSDIGTPGLNDGTDRLVRDETLEDIAHECQQVNARAQDLLKLLPKNSQNDALPRNALNSLINVTSICFSLYNEYLSGSPKDWHLNQNLSFHRPADIITPLLHRTVSDLLKPCVDEFMELYSKYLRN